MIDFWQMYGIFIKRKDRSKWKKLFHKIEKFKKEFQCQHSKIEQEKMQNQIKLVLIKQLLSQLKRESKFKKSKGTLKNKKKKLYKTFAKTLTNVLGERKKAIRLLNASKKKNISKKRKPFGIVRSPQRKIKEPVTPKVATTSKPKKDNTLTKDFNRMMKYGVHTVDPIEATKRLRERIDQDKESLKDINAKIVGAINDINEMDYIIQHIKKNATYNHFRLKPFMDYAYWMKPPKQKKATLIMDRVERAHKKTLVREDILDLKRKYIFDNIPECKVQMFDYLKK